MFILWAAPLLAGFMLSIPLTVLTSSHWFGAFSVRTGLFAIPEDRDMPLIMRQIACRGQSTPAVSGDLQSTLQPVTEAA